MSQAATQQLSFDYLLGVSRRWFSCRQAGEIVGMSKDFVERLVDEGRLHVHRHNTGDGVRDTIRITRESLAAYLVASARYDADMRLQQLLACLPSLTPAQLLHLAEAARTKATSR